MKKVVFILLIFSIFSFSSVFVENGEVIFTFKKALDAKVVYLAGTFNNWSPNSLAMEKEGNVWKISLKLEPGTYQYKYVIEGTNWKEDPEAPGYVDDGFGGKNGIFTLAKKDGELIILKSETKKSESSYEKNEKFDKGKMFIDEEGYVVIRFEYKGADYVTIAGNFNNWNAEDTECYEIDDGIWEAVLELEEGDYQYKFVVNGKDWVTDPNALAFVDDGFGGKNGFFQVFKVNGKLTIGLKEESTKAKPLNVAIIWHHHQPLYKIPGEEQFMMPWVRTHGVNDYPYMADLVKYLKTGKVTFNLVPSLLLQIEDYLKGQLDEYQRLSLNENLTKQEKQFLINHFFDINPQFVNAHERYKELMEKKVSGEEFTDQDLLDLKVCWNLYWINIEYINQDERLKSLTSKKHYTKEDLIYVLDYHKKLLSEIVEKYKTLWDNDKVELITTPFYHPILPILVDMGWKDDAVIQIKEGLSYFEKIFGKRPVGMWPSEQAVSQEVLEIIAENNIKWIVTDKQILQKSGIDIGKVENFLRPYKVKTSKGDVVVFFRDTDLSDRIGFKYSQMHAESAVKDFIETLHQYQKLNKDGNLVITIALDGENAWEHYPNNGNDFRKLLYKKLSEDPLINLVTLSEYIEKFGVKNTLDKIAKGSWVSGSLDTWIGETEENQAWKRLKDARKVLLEKGLDDISKHLLMAAEGSDWFWWYGTDQDAGNNEYLFDMQFKKLLIEMYKKAGKVPPSYLYIVNKRPVNPDKGVIKKVEYKIDGIKENDIAVFEDTLDGNLLNNVFVARGDSGIYVGVELNNSAKSLLGKDIKVEVYVESPTAKTFNAKTYYSNENITFLGFPLSHRFVVNLKTWNKRPKVSFYKANGSDKWILTTGNISGVIDDIVEIEIPYDLINVKSGQDFNLAVVVSENRQDKDFGPNNGPIKVIIPAAISGNVIKIFEDPLGDEYGPGSYVYPKDQAFKPFKGLFDMIKVVVLENEKSFIFQIKFAEMTNPWGAPKGFSHQLINIYLDTKEGGRTDTYKEGARVAFDPQHSWDYFIKVAGWPSYGQFFATSDGNEISDAVRVEANPGKKVINVILLKKYINIETGIYAYILVGSQDGYGPDNFRPVTPEPSQWTLGGYPKDSNDMAPYVLDILVESGKDQREILSSFTKTNYAVLKPVKIK
ncbi:glucodextranase DOMON-like domain-containing protein [Thermosipho melanesiensis]|uniref:Glycoside hydrolase, family 57 n=2 Tax=Thermosipho melanesiensis TaxID=46541 RepID=A6LL63_THEM4|nr:glucodextranase DOMON-like domain-containing protein [Thermosipho melanesiensis]ABR30664.1 glycoside hydrolase, family 57 [Thermosipho melanesiensis BI429]APT73796.1 amylopullulanase [Thermosipho melanesiensis]